MIKGKKIITALLAFIVSAVFISGCSITPISEGGNIIYQNDVKYTLVSPGENIYNDLVSMLDATRPSVYEVYAKKDGEQSLSCGSGTIYAVSIPSENSISTVEGYVILTCHHVIANTDVYMVKDIYGNTFDAELIGGDPDSDIALLFFSPLNSGWKKADKQHYYLKGDVPLKIVIAPLRDEKNAPLKVGESVYAIGNPLGTLGGTVTQGIVSATDRDITVEKKQMSLIQTDCAINSGNSGGGLFDAQGNLVGVVNAGYSGSVEGLNFAIPVDDALTVANSLSETYTGKNYGYVKDKAKIVASYNLGIYSHEDVSFYDYYQDSWFGSTIVAISAVNTNFSAELSKGDQIISVKVGTNELYKVATSSVIDSSTGERYTPAQQLVNYLTQVKCKVGDQVVFTVIKNGETAQKTVTVSLKQYIYKNTWVF